MRIVVLSRGEVVHSTRRLVEAARSFGHLCDVVDPLALQLTLGRRPGLHAAGRALVRPDVVLPRFAQSVNHYGTAVVRQLELSGVPVLNSALALEVVRDKLRLMQLLASRGVPVPATLVGRGASELRRMAAGVGGFPVAVKVVGGPEHSGVLVCETSNSMEASLEAVASMGHTLVVQRHVGRGEGRDLRLLVVDGAVVAAVRRHGIDGRLRHTLGSGRRVTAVRAGKAIRQLAVDAARATALHVAAVDVLDVRGEGPSVFDVHASPGLGELETATGEDLARPIVALAVRLAEVARPRRRAVGRTAAKGRGQ
jgi:ribosomal protein S6--L-glutamate ligase